MISFLHKIVRKVFETMKRVLFFVLALIMVLPLISCSEEGTQRGKIDGNVYENKGVGITFTAPEGWEFMSDEEISVEWNLGNKSFDEQLKSGVAYDAVAKSNKPGAGNTVVFKFEDTKTLDIEKFSMEAYAESIRAELKIQDPMTQIPVTEIEKMKFGEGFYRVIVGKDVRFAIYMKELDDEILFTATVKLLDDTKIADVDKMFK